MVAFVAAARPLPQARRSCPWPNRELNRHELPRCRPRGGVGRRVVEARLDR